ncbi:MAG: Calx-beta domain-containing protein [Pseudomonadota bacterium]|nr:Calx-beta domain-containing protein [Pseudomonadota bacterium]
MPNLNGSSYASYVVRLSRAPLTVIQIPWTTEAGSAVPGEDYEETSGTLSFTPGETEKVIQVLVYGRNAGDDEDRDFTIRLTPTTGVVLAAESTKAVISVVDEAGTTIAAVTVASGPDGRSAYDLARLQGFDGTPAEWVASLKGEQGDKGDDGADGADGEDAYAIAVGLGFEGTAAEWLESLKGEPGADGVDGADAYAIAVAEGYEGTRAEWLASLAGTAGADGDAGADAYEVAVTEGFEGTRAEWLASLKGEDGDEGPAGTDGQNIELQRSGGYLQWRVVGGAWANLVPLADLKGDAGTGLNNRGDWQAATYQPGDYVFAAGSSAATSMWILRGDAEYASSTEPAEDLSAWIEFEAPAGPQGEAGADGDDGAAGADGREIEIQAGATYLQWRYAGDADWTNLIAIADITGPAGADGDDGAAGTNGREIQIQSGATHLQWRYVGDPDWIDLIAIADITGPAGADGEDGADGTGGGGSVTLASTAQAQAAESAEIATTPAGVREYLEQFGLTSTYTSAPGDLNEIVKGQFFNWGNTTGHAPIAGSYGRGICIPSGGGYVTQLSIENNTGAMHARYQENGNWTAWVAVGGGSGGEGGGSQWHTGADAPAAGTGADGDFYLNVTNGDVYGPKTAGEWGSAVGNLMGPAGEGGGSGGGGSGALVAVRSDDIGVTETALADVLSFDVVAGTVYSVRLNLLYRATGMEKGITVGVGGTAGVQSVALHFQGFDQNGARVAKFTKTRGQALVFATSAIGGDDNLITVEGLLFVTGNGTFTLQIGSVIQYDYTAAQKGTSGVLTPVGTIPF